MWGISTCKLLTRSWSHSIACLWVNILLRLTREVFQSVVMYIYICMYVYIYMCVCVYVCIYVLDSLSQLSTRQQYIYFIHFTMETNLDLKFPICNQLMVTWHVSVAWLPVPFVSRAASHWKTVIPVIRVSILKIRWQRDCLIFNGYFSTGKLVSLYIGWIGACGLCIVEYTTMQLHSCTMLINDAYFNVIISVKWTAALAAFFLSGPCFIIKTIYFQ